MNGTIRRADGLRNYFQKKTVRKRVGEMAQHIKGLLCPWEILSSDSQNVCKVSSYGVLPIIPPLVRLREGVPQGKLTGED